MRIYWIFIIFCLFQLLFCELCDNKKVEINEEYINSLITNFFTEIQEILKPINLFGKSSFTIKDFSPKKVQVNIKNDGIANLKIKDVTPIVSFLKNGGCFLRSKYAGLYYENFEMEMNIKFNGNYTSDCKYSPNAELVGNPKVKFKPKVLGNWEDKVNSFKKGIKNGYASKFIIMKIKQVFEIIKKKIITNYHIKMKNQ